MTNEEQSRIKNAALLGWPPPTLSAPCLEAPGVLPRRDPAGDRIQRARIERVPVRGEDEARQLKLLPGLAPNARARHPHPTPAQGDLARRRPRAASLACGIAFPPRSTQLLPVLLHQRVQDLLSRPDAEIEVRAFDARERPQQRERNLHGRRLRPIYGLEGASAMNCWRPGPNPSSC